MQVAITHCHNQSLNQAHASPSIRILKPSKCISTRAFMYPTLTKTTETTPMVLNTNRNPCRLNDPSQMDQGGSRTRDLCYFNKYEFLYAINRIKNWVTEYDYHRIREILLTSLDFHLILHHSSPNFSLCHFCIDFP